MGNARPERQMKSYCNTRGSRKINICTEIVNTFTKARELNYSKESTEYYSKVLNKCLHKDSLCLHIYTQIQTHINFKPCMGILLCGCLIVRVLGDLHFCQEQIVYKVAQEKKKTGSKCSDVKIVQNKKTAQTITCQKKSHI